jgi:transcriptional regulator with XRE-family HTH domain
MSSELAAWLRRQREDRGWTRTELARQLIRAARARGDTSLPGTDNISHNIYRWERGAVTPAERYKLLYCSAFGIPFAVTADTEGRFTSSILVTRNKGLVSINPSTSATCRAAHLQICGRIFWR